MYNSLGSVLFFKENIKLPQMSESDRLKMCPLHTPSGSILILKALLIPPTCAFQSFIPWQRHLSQ